LPALPRKPIGALDAAGTVTCDVSGRSHVLVVSVSLETESRRVRVVLAQNAGTGLDPAKTVEGLARLIESSLQEATADVLCLSEMATTAYFCGTNDRRYFKWAQTVPGPATQRIGELARRYSINVVLPLFERGPRPGQFYNSAVFIDRRGEVIEGQLPDGTAVSCYRKNHISDNYSGTPGTNEKFFFRPGPGFPVFDLDFGRASALICYDRSFPESWRMLAVQGVELVFVVAAIALKHRAESWAHELRTAAVQNGLYVVAVNKGGPEHVEAHRLFSGHSLVVDPNGEIVAEASEDVGDVSVRAELDLASVERHGWRYHYMRDRRPEIYTLLTKVSHV
jgi:predicted amidohydrolase